MSKSNKKNKVRFNDRMAGFLFEEIIDVLVKRYDEYPDKDTKSFYDFCIELKNLSRIKRGKEGVADDGNS